MGEGGVAEHDPAASADVPPPARTRRHSGPQVAVFVINVLVVLGCFTGGAALLVAKHAAEQTSRVVLTHVTEPATTIDQPTTTTAQTTNETVADSAPAVTDVETSTATTEPTTTTAPPRPRYEGENYLVVGIDNNACIDPNSPYAGGIGQRTARLTDTIMMIRVVPSTRHAALLSFPRDLWVHVSGSMRRINTAYRHNDPTALRDTIRAEYGIEVDHFIAVDFCAFMGLVDALGGITVPLPHPVRDLGLGLDIEQSGCHTFAGDEALAYVRSRHLEFRTDAGAWKTDGSSDFGRISRQQDFVRRVLVAAKQHLLDISVLQSLYASYTHHLVIDASLTIAKISEFADLLRDVDPATSRGYQFETTGAKISGQAVLIVQHTPRMDAILDVFRGLAPIGEGDALLPTDVTGPAPGATSPATTLPPPPAAPEPNGPRGAVVPDAASEC